MEIDLLRLMRAAGALARTDEYLRMAQLLRQAGQAAEARKVLAEGRARGLVDPGGSPAREIIAEVERALPRERAGLDLAPPADSLVGAGRYPEAEARYRAALAAGEGDPGEINTRLGMALVLAGRRAEAEAAFRSAALDSALRRSGAILAALAGAAAPGGSGPGDRQRPCVNSKKWGASVARCSPYRRCPLLLPGAARTALSSL